MVRRGAPRPQNANDAIEFVALLRELKEWSGLTYRKLERLASQRGDVLPRSTLSDVLSGRATPRPELLVAFVRACGDGDRVEEWLRVWSQLAEQGPAAAVDPAEPPDEMVERASPAATSRRRFGVPALVPSAIAAVALVTAGAWGLTDDDEPPGNRGAVGGPASTPTGAVPVPPNGWVRIRPVSAPHLCLTDGRVQDRRYVPLVAVQRRCDAVAPQDTMLESMGGDLYRIQWHHPDYGKGCLKALSDGPGVGLLEPIDDCLQDSRFHLEPSAPYGSNRYVLRVDGQGCVGIRESDASEGAEAVMERCVGRGGQVFFIEAAS
ncbi:hypothetical protein GCM10027186_47780 [Micromonospora schwarzwaldensis]